MRIPIRLFVLPVLLPLLAALPGSGAPPEPPSGEAELCVLAPRTVAGPDGGGRAVVPLARPTIFVVGELAGVALLRGDELLWQRQGTPGAPIHGPIAWPLAPIRPGERLQLRLRPIWAEPGAHAQVELVGAPEAVLTRSQTLLLGLGDDPAAWQRAVEAALGRGDRALASALLFAFEGPSGPDLDALRLEAYRLGCDGAGTRTTPSRQDSGLGAAVG